MNHTRSASFAQVPSDTDLTDLLCDRPDNHAAAADLARRGFAVFPVRNWGDGDGWKPVSGFTDGEATADLSKIRAWWRRWPEARVGLLTGAPNGVTVIDVDVKNGKDGIATLAALGFPDLEAMTPVRSRSPSGGWHLFFKHQPGLKGRVCGLGEGLDIRNDRQFVVAPASWKDGKQYVEMGKRLGSVELPPFPETLIPPPEPERPAIEPLSEASAAQREWASEKLATMADDLASLSEGSRQSTLNDTAMWAGGVGVHGMLDREETREILQQACIANGLPEREFKATFDRAWDDGMRKPVTDFPHEWLEDDFTDLPGTSSSSLNDLLGLPAAATSKTCLNDLLGIEVSKPKPLFEPASRWADQPAPPRKWLIEGLIPDDAVTLLAGDGGTGKSLVALQLAAAVATGERWIGRPVDRPGKVLFLSAEDTKDELHRRLEAIRPTGLHDLDNLLAASLVEGDPLLASFDKNNRITMTALYRQVAATVERERPALIVLDTLANLHSGDENNKAHAMQFVNKLKGIASTYGCAVLLLTHPSLTGIANGTGSAGSLGWANAVRSRLFLSRRKDENGHELDPDARVLTTTKANYGKQGEVVDLRWHDGRFIAEGDGFDDLESREDKSDRVFMKLLDRFTAEGTNVSRNTGHTYAPKIFSEQPDAERCTRDDLKGAMSRLFLNGLIRNGEHSSKGKPVSHIERFASNASRHASDTLQRYLV
jgi:RecA-family ATPase